MRTASTVSRFAGGLGAAIFFITIQGMIYISDCITSIRHCDFDFLDIHKEGLASQFILKEKNLRGSAQMDPCLRWYHNTRTYSRSRFHPNRGWLHHMALKTSADSYGDATVTVELPHILMSDKKINTLGHGHSRELSAICSIHAQMRAVMKSGNLPRISFFLLSPFPPPIGKIISL